MPASNQALIFDAGLLAALVQALGTPAFGACLLEAQGSRLRCTHLSAFVFDARLQPHQVMAQSQGGKPLAARAGRLAQDAGMYRFDPNTRVVHAARPGRAESLVTRQRAADITVSAYRLGLYARFDLVDRVSLLARSDGRWFALNFYRSSADGEFDAAALAAFDAAVPLLVALMRRHFEWMPPRVWQHANGPDNASLELRLASLDGGLSQRERQVCARALRGIANPGIAIDLGVQVSTVSTLRRRAFAKLGISTLAELFMLCLWRVGQGGGDSDAGGSAQSAAT